MPIDDDRNNNGIIITVGRRLFLLYACNCHMMIMIMIMIMIAMMMVMVTIIMIVTTMIII
jgi:hypothetical protein